MPYSNEDAMQVFLENSETDEELQGNERGSVCCRYSRLYTRRFTVEEIVHSSWSVNALDASLGHYPANSYNVNGTFVALQPMFTEPKGKHVERFLEVLDEVRLLLLSCLLRVPAPLKKASWEDVWGKHRTYGQRQRRPKDVETGRDFWSSMEEYSGRQFPNCPINLYQETLPVSSNRLLILRVRGQHTQPQK